MVGPVPVAVVAVQRPDIDEDRLARADLAIIQGVGLAHVSRQHPDRRVEPHRLVENGGDAGHALKVLVTARAALQCLSDLFPGAGLRRLVMGQQVECPSQRQRRRFVSRNDEELHVVQQILRRHGATAFRVSSMARATMECIVFTEPRPKSSAGRGTQWGTSRKSSSEARPTVRK